MVIEERYLWFCEFRFHEQGYGWLGYFKDVWEVDAFFEKIAGLLPCLKITLLGEFEEGLTLFQDFYYYRLSSQLKANEERRLNKLKPPLYGQPAPIKRDYLSSFLFGLRKIHPCPQCAPSLPVVEEIRAAARGKRRNLTLCASEKNRRHLFGSPAR
jgi:hypothetical protein